MRGQGELFDGGEYEDPRVESFGEHPPMTKEQFVAFCDSLHDYGEEAYALYLFENYGDLDEVPIEDIMGSLGTDI